MVKLVDIINGSLLGDGSIRSQKDRYYSFKVSATDKRFAMWMKRLFHKFKLRCWLSKDNQALFSTWFYINSCPFPEFMSLRERWYRHESDKIIKIVPKTIELNPITMLFWYLGDGSLVRRKNDENRIPTIVLATNCFSKNDIDFLVGKLEELGLNFYPVKYKSGFTGKDCGCCLYSKTGDGTPFRFFKFIGLECPMEIANFSTGRKGIYREEKFLEDKWPTEEDWIKILSNIKEIGPTLRKKRIALGLSQNQLSSKIGIRRENIRGVELGKRCFRVSNFRKILKALNINVDDLLKVLNTRNL